MTGNCILCIVSHSRCDGDWDNHILLFDLGDTKIVNGDKEASGDEDEEESTFYDKAKSFFDNISCDATEQARG